MIEREDIVAAVVQAAGGNLVGRVRLQKTVYLLDQLGLHSGFNFEYHHFGPYSRGLDNATADAAAFNLVEEALSHRESDGARYSVFKLKGAAKDKAFGDLGRDHASELVKKFAATNVTVLELAATVDWLWRYERRPDWQDEIKRRKPLKVEGGRLERALVLLRDLNLAPPE